MMHRKKYFFCVIFFVNSINISVAQLNNTIKFNAAITKKFDQKKLLQQYIGTWYSADKVDDKAIGNNPRIKMTVLPKLDSSTLQVEVFEMQNNTWKTILVELISYDTISDSIVAAGQNKLGIFFIGKGYFADADNWYMQDVNQKGTPTLAVHFKFLNANEVYLKGTTANHLNEWEVKYIKSKNEK